MELVRLSVLTEVECLRRSLEDMKRLTAAAQGSTGDDQSGLFLAVHHRIAEALRSSREIETFLRDAQKATSEP